MPLRRAVGVLGRAESAEVDERGAVHGLGGSWRLGWSVSDVEGRMRDLATDPSVRHRAIDDTPVFETVMRVNGGDVRQRVYGALAGDVFVVVEIENDSPEPVAVTVARSTSAPPVLSARRPVAPDTFPLPHRAMLRLAVPLSSARSEWPGSLPPAAQVVAGWKAVTARGERLEIPGPLTGRFAVARSQLLLTWTGDPAATLLARGARWRLARESIESCTPQDVAALAQRVADRCRRGATGRDRAALVEAQALLSMLGDLRAAADVGNVLDLVGAHVVQDGETDAASVVAATRAMFVSDRPGRCVDLLPAAAEWARADLAVHHLPSRWGEVSFAVRWHGERPALLWEVETEGQEPVIVHAPTLDPSWRSEESRGEALLGEVSAT